MENPEIFIEGNPALKRDNLTPLHPVWRDGNFNNTGNEWRIEFCLEWMPFDTTYRNEENDSDRERLRADGNEKGPIQP